jgi:hypothetical protein
LKEIVCVMDLMSYQECAITIILNCAKTRSVNDVTKLERLSLTLIT